MFIGFNILLIALVLLIGYWWANQGLFSALLHLLCVIAAGAIALALWEPVTVRWVLRGGGFDPYAWGVVLVGLFIVTLLILRITTDRLIRANVDLPHWANLTFGFPVGVAAGVLTIGIYMLGAGFIQSTNDIMGFEGMRRSNGGRIEEINRLWAPVHEWTYNFYGLLSVTSLSTGQPLRQVYPQLHYQAASLVRDSYDRGRGMVSLAPNAANIVSASTNGDRIEVAVSFDSAARDYGEMLTLSSSQVRLIGAAKGSNEAPVAYPKDFRQHSGFHLFDDKSHYATSEPGQATAKIVFGFKASDLRGAAPRYIQIRGTRFELPQVAQASPGSMNVTGGTSYSGDPIRIDPSGKPIQSAVRLSNDIRPASASANQRPTGVELREVDDEKFIFSSDAVFPTGGMRVSRRLQIRGVFEPDGTRIVQVDVSRGNSAADIYTSVRERAGNNAQITLVDEQGRPYYPIGYIHVMPDQSVRIKVDFVNFSDTLAKLPELPSANTHKLNLLFCVTEGVRIKGLKVGDVTVGTCDLFVGSSKSQGAAQSGDPTPTAGRGGTAME